VLLTTHLLLLPWSWKSRTIPLPTLWTTRRPVKGTLYLYLYLYIYHKLSLDVHASVLFSTVNICSSLEHHSYAMFPLIAKYVTIH